MIATDVASRGLDIKGMGLGFCGANASETEEPRAFLDAAVTCDILHGRGFPCILTETAAPGVKLVINYDAANTPEDYFSRLGFQA